MPRSAREPLLAGVVPPGVTATDIWKYYQGAWSVSNGLGTTSYGLPLAAPGTVNILDGRPRGTVLLLR
jgi:hypothetical protein